MSENKAAQLRKLIFADNQDQFVSPKVKKGDFVLYYLRAIEEEKAKLGRKQLDLKTRNKVLLAAVRTLIKHWKDCNEKNVEEKSQELKLFKTGQKLVSSYEELKNWGQSLSDSTFIASQKVEWNTIFELEDIKPRKRNCDVRFQKSKTDFLMITILTVDM